MTKQIHFDPASMINPWPKTIQVVYGPYEVEIKGIRRRLVIAKFTDGKKTSMSYARWLMTQHLSRILGEDEHVDHIDEDPLNDVIENYQILTRSENVRKSQVGRPSPLKGMEKGWTHGSIYGWMQKKCICQICSLARDSWNQERSEKRRLKEGEGSRGPRGPYKKVPVHGTTTMYRKGCRCDECRIHNKSQRQRVKSH